MPMQNTFMENLTQVNNYVRTENFALAHKSLQNDVYQMFALGGSYRKRSDSDCVLLFKNAFEQNPDLALKCLFYLRDIEKGAGERRFFRVCFNWLAKTHTDAAFMVMDYVPDYGRFDDVIYALMDTPLEGSMLEHIKRQLVEDMYEKHPSLLAKWLPSINASSETTKRAANKIRKYLHMTNKEYRKTLSELRERIRVVEKLMSANRWEEIDFDKIPSKAGLIYKNAFARRDLIAEKYKEFAASKDTKVNAKALYPYEIVAKATEKWGWYGSYGNKMSETDIQMLEKYWENLPDYFNGTDGKMLCVVDTSGSMTGSQASAPINVAISLGIYCAERIGGPFKDHYISFSSRPQLIKIEGTDFVDKVHRIYRTNLCENTDLLATFEMLRQVAKTADPADIPSTIVVISDMQIDEGTCDWRNRHRFSDEKLATEMEQERMIWEADGLKMPKLVYWNVDARGAANFLDNGPDVTYVSGFSPSVFEAVLKGKTGWDLCLDKLLSERYEKIHV